ncbi:flavodoxin domain-containing protein [Neptunomonas japonica]|uniref:Flavodoxin n=1 Tax=Neptunomonas japonica JAMM 1380 TaxID=1441457 RepID=A0A7R6SWP8_9GAMM|nr:flavodoxin domain-containing protein [Neptunomonas japonica]BBB30646.1 flavodoxin [Neptunomonas japonica JAMM 1380]
MASVKFLVGSTYGNAQQVAEDASDQFADLGHLVKVISRPTIDDILASDTEVVIICSATIGEGEIPDSLLPFHSQLSDQFPLLSHIKYGVIALGDSSYDNFADGGRQMDELMTELKAVAVQDMLIIDACETPDPEEAVIEWMSLLHQKI